MMHGDLYGDLGQYGQMGVNALAAATPKDTGETASSWTYRITKSGSGVTIAWYNTNVNGNAVIALLLQYGHGTGTGGYVVGRDYINPATRPVFDQIAEAVWKKVTSG
jgi:hypothetical protein